MARRVNTRFLIVLTAVVFGLVVAAFAALKLSGRDDPAKYIAAGDQLTAEGDYEQALHNYRQAVAIDQRDPALWVKLGDAFNRLGGQDTANVNQAQGAWAKALEIDPQNVDALTRIFELREGVLELGGPDVVAMYEQARSAADKLGKADPTNTRAAAAVHEFVLRGWMAGVQTDASRIDEAMAGLVKAAANRPDDADPPYYLALAKAYRAQDEFRVGDPEGARALLAEAEAVIIDAVDANPDHATMHFRASQVLSMLASAQQSDEARQSFVARAREHLARAHALAQPDDKHYVAIALATARTQQTTDRAAAGQTLRELLAAKPDDQIVRLAAAEHLSHDPATRDEAKALLEQPLATGDATGARAYLLRSLEVQTTLALTNVRLDQFAATRDPAARERLLPQVEDGLSKIVARIGEENAPVLQLKGKLQRIQGKNVEAIQTLNKAKGLLEQQYLPEQRDMKYYELLDQLARAYIAAQQNGAARQLLSQIADRAPGHLPTQLLLAQLLVNDRLFDQAQPHIDFVAKALPQQPEVVKLQLAALLGADVEADKNQIAALYARLPEQTKAELVDKARTASAIGQRDEAVRLLAAARAKSPEDLNVAVALARAYLAVEQKPKAAAVLDEALAANPDNPGLKLLAQQLSDGTGDAVGAVSAADVRALQRQAATQIADPVARELRLAELDRADGNRDEAFKRLVAAEKLEPDNEKVLEALFVHHVAARQWEPAEEYVERLAKMNADKAGGLLFRYRLAMARGDAAAALVHARDLAAQMPEFSLSWQTLGQALHANAKPEEAVERYRRALELQSDNPDAIRGIIESYLALNRPDDAKRYIEQGVERYPTDAYFREIEIKFELTYGDPQKAIGPRQEAVRRQPENAGAWAALGQAYMSAARARLNKNDEPGAREHLGKVLETAREARAKFPDDARFYRAIAEASLALKKPEDGEAALRELAARDAWKDRPEPRLMLAELYARAGRAAEAEQVLRDVLASHATSVEAQLSLASLLSQTGHPSEALVVLQSANGEDDRVLRQRVELQIALGQLDDADQTLQAALAKSPDSTELLALSGFVNYHRRKYDEATARLGQALALEPNDAFAMYSLALVKRDQTKPDLDEAVRLLTAARDLQPQFVDARVALAEVHRRRNNNDGAVRELDAALQAQPANKRIRLALVSAYNAYVPPRWLDVERTLREGRELPQFKADVDLMVEEARMWSARRDGAKAAERMKEAVAASGQNPMVVRLYLTTLLEARDYAAAAREAEAVMAKDPNAWWAQLTRAVARRRSGDKEGAVADFEQALATANAFVDDGAAQQVIRTVAEELGVDEALARISARAQSEPRWQIIAAQFHHTKGDLPAAAAAVEQALADVEQLGPGDRVGALRMAGMIYMSMRTQPEAQKAYDAYRRLLELRPDDLYALNNMACLLAETISPPRPGEAIKYSQRAYDQIASAGRRDPMVMDTHGWVLTLNGRTDEGIDLLRQAVDARPFAEGYYHLAEAYLKAAYPEEALRNLELARQELQADEEAKRQVDEALRQRIDDATKRAGDAIGDKASARSLP